MSVEDWPMQGRTRGGRAGELRLGLNPHDTSEATEALRAAETMYELAMQQMPQKVDVLGESSGELLIYPEGERDAVTITERDMEGLQTMGFISNNIVDFYVRYLEIESGLPLESRNRLYFFSSFFFTKLFNSTASTGIDRCKVDYEQVRKWSEEVNLFERDYVFIPVLKSSHWSLVMICHLSSLTRSPDEIMRSPCIVHLDPIEGHHESFEGMIRSYLLQAWMERFDPSSNVDQLLALCQMKYVQAKVPQQKNSHDCGLYVLNYIEAFLFESTSPDLSFNSSERALHFTSHDFVHWALDKRTRIQNLILERSRLSQERARKCKIIKDLTDELLQISQKLWAYLENEGDCGGFVKDVQTDGPPAIWNSQDSETKPASTYEDAMDIPHPQTVEKSMLDYEPLLVPESEHAEYQETNDGFSVKLQHPEPDETPCVTKPLQGSNKRGRIWSEEETMVLVKCKAEGGRFYTGRRSGTDWKLICKEIGSRLGNMPTEEQCRRRYDTLKKAYEACKKYCVKSGKTFGEITVEERIELRLATRLSEEWYTAIDEICEEARSHKRIKMKSNGCDATAPSALASPTGGSFEGGAAIVENDCEVLGDMSRNDAQLVLFRFLNEDLQCTLVDLVQECTRPGLRDLEFNLDLVCGRLAILQGCEPEEILKHCLKLWELNFVTVKGSVFEEGKNRARTDLWKDRSWSLTSGVYDEISTEVLRKNPHMKTYYRYFPLEQSSLQYVKVLTLICFSELKHLELREFPNLRLLAICECENLTSVTGWEAATGLGSLDIQGCYSYRDFPDVQYLSSLREFTWGRKFKNSKIPWQLPQLSRCVQLRRLEIWDGYSCLESVDLESLKELKLLECLSLGKCEFSTIQGLRGLQGLTKLRLRFCSNLRRVPELGCLKGLTELDLSWSGVEDISGVEELHLLTSLKLCGCRSLRRIPFLGRLTALVYLNIEESSVTEFLGREHLINLKTMLGP